MSLQFLTPDQQLGARPTVSDPRLATVNRLTTIAQECSQGDWDRYGAEPISGQVYDITRAVIESLPHGFPMPDLAPLPDGTISLDWAKTGVASFSVSISADGRIDYAWLDGIKSGSGKSTVDGVTLPKWLLGNIRDFLR